MKDKKKKKVNWKYKIVYLMWKNWKKVNIERTIIEIKRTSDPNNYI